LGRVCDPGCAARLRSRAASRGVCVAVSHRSSAPSSQNGPLRLALGIRRGRSFPGSTARWSAGGALTSPPVTTSFLLSSAANLPPRSTRRHPRARPTIASSISRQTTRRARAPACGWAAAGRRRVRGGAETGQRRSSTRAETGQPLCRWSRGVDSGRESTTRHPSPAAAGFGVGACSGRGRHRRGGGERRACRRTDLPRPAGTGGDLKAGTGGGTGARPQMLLSWWRRRRESVRLPSCSRG
jgi:hypothetical protein